MQKTFNKIVVLIFFLTTSCSNTVDNIKKGLGGQKRNTTDEFLVKKKDPLTLPPKFKDLPVPGQNMNLGDDTEEEVIDIEQLLKSKSDKTSSIKGNTWKIPRNIPKETGWPEWKKLLNFWEDQLEILAKEFMDGRLVITPIKKEETCCNCGYQTLCRIGESGMIDKSGEFLE